MGGNILATMVPGRAHGQGTRILLPGLCLLSMLCHRHGTLRAPGQQASAPDAPWAPALGSGLGWWPCVGRELLEFLKLDGRVCGRAGLEMDSRGRMGGHIAGFGEEVSTLSEGEAPTQKSFREVTPEIPGRQMKPDLVTDWVSKRREPGRQEPPQRFKSSIVRPSLFWPAGCPSPKA